MVISIRRTLDPTNANFGFVPSQRNLRDGIIKYDVMQIEAERRNGYRWYVDKPSRLLADYPAWNQSYVATARQVNDIKGLGALLAACMEIEK